MMANGRYPTLGVERITPYLPLLHDFALSDAKLNLAAQLKDLGCTRVLLGGLATDYCVKATALDAREASLDVTVLEDAVRAANLQPGDGQRALEEMTDRGVLLSSVERLLA